MEKNKFIKSAIILIIGAFITKVLGMIIKIVTTRYIGLEGIGIYMLILPTFILFVNIASLGFPVAVSKVIAEEKMSSKKIILSIIPVSLILNLILIIIIYFISPLISNLLHDSRTLYPIMAIGLILPFISLTSIIRGYFFGKERMIPHTISHISEQIIRLILIIIFIPFLLKYSVETAVTGIILMNILSELTSIIILIFFLPKNIKITKKDIVPDKTIIKDVLNIGIPTTGSRIIGSINYFFEPIIITFILLKIGYSNAFIINEYGILNGYVLPLLMIPSFFTMAVSSALIPVISKNYANGNIKFVKSKLKQGLIISLTIGIFISVIITIYPMFFLKLVYNTTEGATYLKLMAPFFIFYYLQVPFTSTLQAINKAKDAMMSTLIGAIAKTILLIALSFLKIGLYSLVIATIVNIVIVTYHNYIKVKKALY